MSGTVQGVGFRAFARREALRLGLSGYAENLLDGRVEVVVVGGAVEVEAFERALARGPSYSRVDRVIGVPIADSEIGLSGFHIR